MGGYEQFGIVALTTTSKSYFTKQHARLASFKKDKGYRRVPCHQIQMNEHVRLGTTLQVVVDKASLQFRMKRPRYGPWNPSGIPLRPQDVGDPIDLSHIPKGTPLAFAVSIGTGYTQTVRLCTEDELSE